MGIVEAVNGWIQRIYCLYYIDLKTKHFLFLDLLQVSSVAIDLADKNILLLAMLIFVCCVLIISFL